MKTNIPIYRAKSYERKDIYVTGFLIGVDEETSLCTIRTEDDYIGGEICYLYTLSIHFEDMLDSQGNKIFASLQEDGKGGDIVENYSFNDDYKSQISIYDNCNLCLVDKDGDTYRLSEINYDGIKVVGVQE